MNGEWKIWRWFKSGVQSPESRVRTSVPANEQERKHREVQRVIALASMPSSSPLWVAVLEIVDEHERNMLAEVLHPGLSDADRHYYAGRAAAAELLANAFRDLKQAADLKARKLKDEE